MELKELIAEYKEKTGCRDANIANQLGVSRSTVMRWSNGEIRRLSPGMMKRLSELFGYDVAPLLKGYDVHYTLPVLGYVKAGYNLFAEENRIGEEDVSYDELMHNDYYLKVTGNSMIGDGIMDGSYVLVRQCNTLNNGEIGVVLIGDEVTVKRVIKKDKVLILEASNPEIENRYFTAEEVHTLPVQIIGKVISCKTYF